MRIVASAADIIKSKLINAKKAANVALGHDWLVENVHWGAYHCPDVQAVERHMYNWGAIQKDGRALAVIESSVQHYGRNSLLDWPTKLAIIVGKTDVTSLRYVVEALFTHMWRKNDPDPYGATELKKVITEIRWARTYTKTTCRQYSELFKSPTDPAYKQQLSTVALVKHYLDSPPPILYKDGGP